MRAFELKTVGNRWNDVSPNMVLTVLMEVMNKILTCLHEHFPEGNKKERETTFQLLDALKDQFIAVNMRVRNDDLQLIPGINIGMTFSVKERICDKHSYNFVDVYSDEGVECKNVHPYYSLKFMEDLSEDTANHLFIQKGIPNMRAVNRENMKPIAEALKALIIHCKEQLFLKAADPNPTAWITHRLVVVFQDESSFDG